MRLLNDFRSEVLNTLIRIRKFGKLFSKPQKFKKKSKRVFVVFKDGYDFPWYFDHELLMNFLRLFYYMAGILSSKSSVK